MQCAAPGEEVEPGKTLLQYYARLRAMFGPQGWWPARTRLEVILGAILTQNTAWRNAVLALRNLRTAGVLNWSCLRRASRADVETCIRPAGFYRQKARTIRTFVTWLTTASKGSLAAVFARPSGELRRELLKLKGFGEETVDTILLYAGQQAFFVADAYTRRVLARHGLVPPTANYAAVQDFLHRNLPPDQALFNDYHALLVEVGKRYCWRQAPRCGGCPLEMFLPSHPLAGPERHARPGGEKPEKASRSNSSQGHALSAGTPRGGELRPNFRMCRV